MVNDLEKYGRSRMIALGMVLMLASLFLSRGFLSGAMMYFIAVTLVHKNIVSQLRAFIKDPFLVSITILFFIPFVSALWSENMKEWGEIMRIKIPLLFFPLAFAGDWKLKKDHWVIIALIFLALMVVSVSWSLAQYITNIQGFNEAYLRSKTILTPLEDDHVRFSWLVAFSVMLSVLLLHIQENWKGILIFLVIFFITYLHILAARMGLFSLYIFIVIYATWLLFNKARMKFFFFLVSGMIILPVASWFIFPTFRNRIQYFLYDLSLLKNEAFVPGSNDGARIQSLKAGWEILKQNPGGVGAGDLKSEVFSWYGQHVAGMSSGQMFLPCSEWLIYGGFAGWAGIILITAVMALPFFIRKIKYRVFWIALHAIVAFSLAMDMTIEAQFGVFIYVFIVLWWWKWFQLQQNEQ